MSDRRKILVVEDEAELRDVIMSILSEQGYDVVPAENGVEALKLLALQNFHLIVSDLRMPEMNGFELFRNAQNAGVLAPFVFLTGFNDVENIMRALRLGAFDFIRKPFDPQEVISVVVRAIEVGYRREKIESQIQQIPAGPRKEIDRQAAMINLIRIANDKNRSG